MENNLVPSDDNVHALLDPPMPAYSSTTVRRAFIVWLNLGQQPEFKQVCNFYHHLEEKERTMTPEERVKSRTRELSLYYKQPSLLDFNQRKISTASMRQIKEIMSEVCVFKLEGFCELRADKYVKTKDVLRISKIIRDYCKSHSTSLRDLFFDFVDFTKKTNSKKSFNVITGYIKNKFIKDELQLYLSMHNIYCKLEFLNDDFDEVYKFKKEMDVSTIEDHIKRITIKKIRNSPTFDFTKDLKTPNAIRILANEARKKDILNRSPRWIESRKDGSNNIMW